MPRAIGDTVFSHAGKPGVIVGRVENSSKVLVEREGETFDKTRRHGFINGLEKGEREAYENIHKEVKDLESIKERVKVLKNHVDTLKRDPRNQRLAKYLEADLSHTMMSYDIHPKVYETDEHHVR